MVHDFMSPYSELQCAFYAATRCTRQRGLLHKRTLGLVWLMQYRGLRSLINRFVPVNKWKHAHCARRRSPAAASVSATAAARLVALETLHARQSEALGAADRGLERVQTRVGLLSRDLRSTVRQVICRRQLR